MVRVYSACLSSFDDFASFRNAVSSFLPEGRITISERYRHENDRNRSFLAEAIIHFIIHHETGLFPKDYRIVENQHGKPLFIGNGINYFFNLSHSHDLVVVATGNDITGVDIERRRMIDPAMALRMLGEQEQKAFRSLDGHEVSRFLLQTWTMKESYLKATGSGLRVPMNSFQVLKFNDEYRIITGGKMDPDFRLAFFDIDPDYELSVCSADRQFSNKVAGVDPGRLMEFWRLAGETSR